MVTGLYSHGTGGIRLFVIYCTITVARRMECWLTLAWVLCNTLHLTLSRGKGYLIWLKDNQGRPLYLRVASVLHKLWGWEWGEGFPKEIWPILTRMAISILGCKQGFYYWSGFPLRKVQMNLPHTDLQHWHQASDRAEIMWQHVMARPILPMGLIAMPTVTGRTTGATARGRLQCHLQQWWHWE